MLKVILIYSGLITFSIFIFFGLPITLSFALGLDLYSFSYGIITEFAICFIFFMWFVSQINKKNKEVE